MIGALINRIAATVPTGGGPSFKSRLGVIGEEFLTGEAMAVCKVIRIIPAEQGVLGPLHDQTSNRNWMHVPTETSDPGKTDRGRHDRAVQAHSTAGIGKPAESNAIDAEIEIGVLTRHFDGIKQG